MTSPVLLFFIDFGVSFYRFVCLEFYPLPYLFHLFLSSSRISSQVLGLLSLAPLMVFSTESPGSSLSFPSQFISRRILVSFLDFPNPIEIFDLALHLS